MEINFTIENPLPPLWMIYPEIPQYSIGWRMGYGESYNWIFNDWFDELSQEDQLKYQVLFPAPCLWRGYYGDIENNDDQESYFQNGINFWQPNGVPEFSLEQLKADASGGKEFDYLFFWGHHVKKEIGKSCFSQWWNAHFRVNAHNYCCMEQYMMAEKARLFGDEEVRTQILAETDPKTIKALGRKVKGFNQNVWDKFKYAIVLNGNYAKFIQNREILAFLLNTEDKVLVEASPYDIVWGIGMQETNPEAYNPWAWKGENLLGFALMEVRRELRRILHSYHLIDWKLVEKAIE